MAGLVILDNGEKLAPAVYAAYLRLREKARWAGLDLWVNSGFREAWEQEAIFRSRYVTADRINGRYVYDVRVWQGVRWYRISSAGTVAVPGTSLHEKASAVDFGGPALGEWLRANGPSEGFQPTGYGFGEIWHYDFWGDPWAGSGSSPFYDTEDDMPTMNEFLNTAAFDNGPTISTLLRELWFGNPTWNRTVDRGLDAGGQPVLVPALQELADAKTVSMTILAMLRSGGLGADVDELELAKALAPLLVDNLGALSDADVARVARAAADEQDRRARDRLGSD